MRKSKEVKIVAKGNRSGKLSITGTWIGFNEIPIEKEDEYEEDLKRALANAAHYLKKAGFDISTFYLSIKKKFN